MMNHRNSSLQLLGIFLWMAAFLIPSCVSTKTCLMLYQIADNNLQPYLMQDYKELGSSPVIRSKDLIPWIYFDALDSNGGALYNTVDTTGQTTTTNFNGTRYITFNHTAGKMQVIQDSTVEQNSDLVTTVTKFLEHALTDCQSQNATSTIAIFSSHGGGFLGYGGDDHKGRRKERQLGQHEQRKLLISNADLSTAIGNALNNTYGNTTTTTNKLDVLGFDACLMQALGAADNYMDVTQNILASESVEPGHGWAYNYIENATSALNVAEQILNAYVTQTQGYRHHATPKILAIVNTNKFKQYVIAMESFFLALKTQIRTDLDLHTFTSRARSNAIAYMGVLDVRGTKNPSQLDFGSFYNDLKTLCQPTPGSNLDSLLTTTIAAYSDMVVLLGVGPGTANGTGMHVSWPHQGEYKKKQGQWNAVLFNNPTYVTHIAPNLRSFLQYFLKSTTPPPGGSVPSVCTSSVVPQQGGGQQQQSTATAKQATGQKKLLLNTTLVLPTTPAGNQSLSSSSSVLTSIIGPSVSHVVVRYGIDHTAAWQSLLAKNGLQTQKPSPQSSAAANATTAKAKKDHDDSSFYMFGGDVDGKYEGATYTAEWDRIFYFISVSSSPEGQSTNDGSSSISSRHRSLAEISTTVEMLTVFDEGVGSKRIPALYFPPSAQNSMPSKTNNFSDWTINFDVDNWIDNYGALFSFIQFSVDQETDEVRDSNLNLYTSDSWGLTFSEQPRDAGGLVIPLVDVHGYYHTQVGAGGGTSYYLETLPGGINQTVIEWSANATYTIFPVEADDLFEVVPNADAVVKAVHAYEYSTEANDTAPDFEILDVIRPSGSSSSDDEYVVGTNSSMMPGGGGGACDGSSNIFCHDSDDVESTDATASNGSNTASGSQPPTAAPEATNDTKTSAARSSIIGSSLLLSVVVGFLGVALSQV